MSKKENANPAAVALRNLRQNYTKSREQILKINADRPAPEPCNCGRTDGTHKASCPEYKRLASQKSRARKKQAQEQETQNNGESNL